VPANRNIYFQALDEDLMMVQTERTYVNYMPGEIRSCIGCHETPDTAPGKATRRLPLAAARKAAELVAQPGEPEAGKLFDYDRQVQPVWNKHCSECHNPEKQEGKLDLSGTPQGVYSISYNNLVKLGKDMHKQVLGNRAIRDEDVATSDSSYLPPGKLGALSSPLAYMLSGGGFAWSDPALRDYAEHLLAAHETVALGKQELLTITNWLDVNCPYHPSYWGRLHEKYRDHPNYRPAVSFEDAIDTEVPEVILFGESQAQRP
jgi:hypothetical protein